MITIITTLPIYDKVAKQCYERSSRSGNGIIPIQCPRHRLPSFQWIDDTDGAATVSTIETITRDDVANDIFATFTVLPTLEHDYFVYSGEVLTVLLDPGIYYLRITMNNAKVYYSEWFQVNCVYGDDTGIPPTATYSTKYLILNFSNTCELGNIYYSGGFTQTLWFESEPMETTFPIEEEGVKNGEGRFVRTFARQVKKYIIRTKAMPDYMADVFNRMKLHDTVTLVDLVGDTHTVYNLEVEHEWLFQDKYYVKFEITLDYDETFVITGCCNNLT